MGIAGALLILHNEACVPSPPRIQGQGYRVRLPFERETCLHLRYLRVAEHLVFVQETLVQVYWQR